jgi:Putative restriction endonuclease
MSTIKEPAQRAISSPLVEGQRLDQMTFHERYEAMPAGTRAELINGVVHMPSPVGPEHGRALVPTLVWLSYYLENTHGVDVLDNTSTALSAKGEPQPDAQLRILPEYGGRTQTDRRFVRGVEVSHATRYTDLGPKFDDYERAGVLEYVVRALGPDEVQWFVLREGRLVELPPESDGIFRSETFPGLWLDPRALVTGDTRRLRVVLDQGMATTEHSDFVSRLAAAHASS